MPDLNLPEPELSAPENTALRSFYLDQAPPEVRRSLMYLHSHAAESVSQPLRRHTDVVLTYVAELTRLSMEQELTIGMAGLGPDGEG